MFAEALSLMAQRWTIRFYTPGTFFYLSLKWKKIIFLFLALSYENSLTSLLSVILFQLCNWFNLKIITKRKAREWDRVAYWELTIGLCAVEFRNVCLKFPMDLESRDWRRVPTYLSCIRNSFYPRNNIHTNIHTYLACTGCTPYSILTFKYLVGTINILRLEANSPIMTQNI